MGRSSPFILVNVTEFFPRRSRSTQFALRCCNRFLYVFSLLRADDQLSKSVGPRSPCFGRYNKCQRVKYNRQSPKQTCSISPFSLTSISPAFTNIVFNRANSFTPYRIRLMALIFRRHLLLMLLAISTDRNESRYLRPFAARKHVSNMETSGYQSRYRLSTVTHGRRQCNHVITVSIDRFFFPPNNSSFGVATRRKSFQK